MLREDGKTRNDKWLFRLLAVLVLLALGGFAYVLVNQWPGTEKQITNDNAGQPATGGRQSDDAPLSLLPDEPQGVTIIEKQADLPETDTAVNGTTLPNPAAPIAQGAEVASGFAMDLGSADAFLELSRRFAAISETNGPENFQRLEPRAILRDTVSGLEARLLVGPFQTEDAARDACSVLILDPGMECSPAPFAGELIPRR